MMHRLLIVWVNTGQEDAGSVEKRYDECTELLDDLLLDVERLVGKPGPLMNKGGTLKKLFPV